MKAKKTKIVLEIVYNDETCDHPYNWDWCELTGEIAIVMDSVDMEPSEEEAEQLS